MWRLLDGGPDKLIPEELRSRRVVVVTGSEGKSLPRVLLGRSAATSKTVWPALSLSLPAVVLDERKAWDTVGRDHAVALAPFRPFKSAEDQTELQAVESFVRRLRSDLHDEMSEQLPAKMVEGSWTTPVDRFSALAPLVLTVPAQASKLATAKALQQNEQQVDNPADRAVDARRAGPAVPSSMFEVKVRVEEARRLARVVSTRLCPKWLSGRTCHRDCYLEHGVPGFGDMGLTARVLCHDCLRQLNCREDAGLLHKSAADVAGEYFRQVLTGLLIGGGDKPGGGAAAPPLEGGDAGGASTSAGDPAAAAASPMRAATPQHGSPQDSASVLTPGLELVDKRVRVAKADIGASGPAEYDEYDVHFFHPGGGTHTMVHVESGATVEMSLINQHVSSGRNRVQMHGREAEVAEAAAMMGGGGGGGGPAASERENAAAWAAYYTWYYAQFVPPAEGGTNWA